MLGMYQLLEEGAPVTDYMAWRWRWLLQVGAGLRELRTMSGSPTDGRQLRAMTAELRAARCQVRRATTLAADVAALCASVELSEREALAVALRLRGASWRTAAHQGGMEVGHVRAAWQRLAVCVCAESAEVATKASGVASQTARDTATASVPTNDQVSAGRTPGNRHSWVAWARDLGFAHRALWQARVRGSVPPDTEARPMWAVSRRARGGAYVVIRCSWAMERVWSGLRACGLRLLVPVGG